MRDRIILPIRKEISSFNSATCLDRVSSYEEVELQYWWSGYGTPFLEYLEEINKDKFRKNNPEMYIISLDPQIARGILSEIFCGNDKYGANILASSFLFDGVYVKSPLNRLLVNFRDYNCWITETYEISRSYLDLILNEKR